MAISSLGYVGLGGRDLAAWHSFAENIIGAEVSDVDGVLRARIDSRAWRLQIEQSDKEDILFVGWETASTEALAETVELLKAQGIEVEYDATLADRRGVVELVRFTDPEGIACELYWGATERFEKPLVSPAGVTGFVTGDEGLGHIVIAVSDADAYETFYKALGFKISDYISMPIGPEMRLPVTFMHCNPRHHTLAFAPMPAPKKLIHLMVQVESLDDVGHALDRVKVADVPIATTLGRHSNDHMVSFYMVTPSGFELEYGWGARRIDESWQPVRHEVTSSWGHEMLITPDIPSP